MCACSATHSCLTVCGPMDCNTPLPPISPDSSAGKESACNLEDPGSTPGSARSPGEGIGYPLQYSWASLVIQMVKNLPAMRETWVLSLGWKDHMEEGMASHSSILAWRITEKPGGLQCLGSQRAGRDWATMHKQSTGSSVHGISQARILNGFLEQINSLVWISSVKRW